MPRISMTLREKKKLVEAYDNLPRNLNTAEKARKLNVKRTTLLTILKDRTSISERHASNDEPSRKRKREGAHADVDKALWKWFVQKRQQHVTLSGPMLKEKAQDFASQLSVDFVASDGWLQRWRARHGVEHKRAHGERNGADQVSASTFISNELPDILSRYADKEVYNADEFALYFRLLPETTMAHRDENVSGGKKSKDRLTGLVCTNMDGSDKKKLLVLGKSRNPRCFKGKKNLPTSYEANKNAWMTTEVFDKWVKDWDCQLRREGRKVVLFIDNCSAHRGDLVNEVTNIELVFLPPHTTSVIQPCDQGIIRNLKHWYRSALMRTVIDLIDISPPGVEIKADKVSRKITVYKALTLLRDTWTKVTPITIANSFRHGGFTRPSTDGPQPSDVADGTDAAAEPPEGVSGSAWSEFLAFDDNLCVSGSLSDVDILQGLLPKTTDEVSDEDDEVSAVEPVLSDGELRQMFHTLRQGLIARGSDQDIVEHVESAMLQFCRQTNESKRQAKITDFFV